LIRKIHDLSKKLEALDPELSLSIHNNTFHIRNRAFTQVYALHNCVHSFYFEKMFCISPIVVENAINTSSKTAYPVMDSSSP